MNALTPVTASTNAEAYRASTDAAGMCRDIVVATASTIQGRKFVSVEGWQAIAIAHGCTAGARDVEKVDGGVRAIGEVRRMSDGGVISTAEGFVGEDEPTWYGGNSRGKQLPKRADYAIRAMAQTRAISRACRSAFAHVVVMMNAGLQTTPAEEVPEGGFDNGNVIEHAAGNERSGGPEARSKLDGPHTSKTALMAAVKALTAEIGKADTPEKIDTLLKGNATVKQAARDWPALLDGEPDNPDIIGLKAYTAQRREALAASEDGMLGELLRSMKECETLKSLTAWMATNEVLIDALEDADRRRFEIEIETFESGLTLVAQRN